jgi:hypothetical protein
VVGAAVAQSRYDIAIALSALNLITLRLLMPIKERLDSDKEDLEKKED